jgi:hypothetical protein
MEIHQRDGRTRRQVEVPICAQCAGHLQKSSAAEERLQRQSRLFVPLAAVLILIAALLLLPGILFGLRLLIAIILAIIAGVVVYRLFRRAAASAALPEKKAVRASAELQSFTWRTATFSFTNATFIDRLVELNDSIIQPA